MRKIKHQYIETIKIHYNYNCIISASSTASTGQGKTQTLSCSGGSFITITSATYSRGRTCGDANALSIVEGLCNDQATCSITADDATFTASTCNANQRESLRVAYVCTIRKYLIIIHTSTPLYVCTMR